MNNVEFIPNHKYLECWCCEGKGCLTCKNTGKFKEEHWILVYTNKEGQKIAFGVDSLK